MAKRSPQEVFSTETAIVKYRWEFFIRKEGHLEQLNQCMSRLFESLPQDASAHKEPTSGTNEALDWWRLSMSQFARKQNDAQLHQLGHNLEIELGPLHVWAPFWIDEIKKEASKKNNSFTKEEKKFWVTIAFLVRRTAEASLLHGNLGAIPAVDLSSNRHLMGDEHNALFIDTSTSLPKPIIDVRLDLSFPKEDVLAHLAQIIDIYEKNVFKLPEALQSRKRFDVYDNYLKVWDMRNEIPKKSWDEVSLAVFKDASGDNKRKCQIYFRKCEELVDGGYKDIK